jgi:predicted ferric reductase
VTERVHPLRVTTFALCTAAAVTLVGLWPVWLAYRAGAAVWSAATLAHVCGMLAGAGVLFLIMLMSRWPVVERGLGSDRLARWHARAGRLVLLLVIIHAGAALQAWADSRSESVPTALWHVLGLPWLLSTTLGTLMFLAIGVMSLRLVRNRISYETWHAAHLFVYLAIALSFMHQLGGPDLAGHPVLQITWALLYCYTFGLVFLHRLLAPLRLAQRHRLRVVAVEPEAPGVVSIILGGQHLEELQAQPGQFFRWRFLTPDTWRTAHPFSLSAPPTPHRLRLTVKSLGDGSRVLQHVDVGTWVVAEGPYGVMTAARRTRRHVLLVAGGVGITPLRALFESIPLAPGQDLLLLYRARRREDLVFRDELDTLAQERHARVIYLLGDSADHLSSDSLLRLVPHLTQRDVFMCGPPRMASSVRAALADAGLPAAQLHEERFAW